jgi:DNA (cytosine-5)-methyltransferase 1
MLLNCVDLFTGIGGFSLALKDVCRTIAFCDSNPNVIKWIESKIAAGKLDDAPIVHDVKDVSAMKKAVSGKRVHIITAGFPCVGFSVRGWRKGLDDDRSALFYAAVDMIKALRPAMVFFENVSEVLSSNDGKDIAAIRTTMTDLGYDMSWTVCSALDVGALHLRKRWFCLCVKRGFLPPAMVADRLFDWSTPPALILPDAGLETSKRLFMLGNALVPLCARLCFFRMLSGFDILTVDDMDGRTVKYRVPAFHTLSKTANCKHAAVDVDGTVYCHKAVIRGINKDARIEVSPSHFQTQAVYVENPSRPQRSPSIKNKVVLDKWPTPRTGGITHSHNLSERTIKDVSTVAMYASSVGGKRQARTRDGLRINPRYVEWLMGFPIDWTKTR